MRSAVIVGIAIAIALIGAVAVISTSSSPEPVEIVVDSTPNVESKSFSVNLDESLTVKSP